MRLKSFHARTMSEAIAEVRQALGPDAIIVATRENSDGSGVRVTAAVETSDSDRASGPAASAPEPDSVTAGPDRPRAPDSDGPDPGEAALGAAERAALRPTAEPTAAGVASAADARASQSARETVAQALTRQGLPEPVRGQIEEAMAHSQVADARVGLARALETVFDFQPLSEEAVLPRPVAFIGPPGSGKTLAVAKLAASAVMNGLTPAVITTDTIRAGGVEQLAAFTRILGLKLMTADDPLVLADCVAAAGEADQVLIDTGGRNPFNAEEMGELGELLSVADIDPVLVLAAGGDPEEAGDVACAFAQLGAGRLLTSRIDMTRRLGSLFAAAAPAPGQRLAFGNVSNTPRVAEGLPPLTSGLLASLLLSRPSSSTRPLQRTGTRP